MFAGASAPAGGQKSASVSTLDGGVVWSKRFIKIDRMDSKKHLNLLSNADKYLQIN